MQDYHQLDIWRSSMDYAVAIYEFSANLPPDERYNMVVQVRRAVTSVPLNMAEGSGCATNREFAWFLQYAYRSLKEAVTCLELCQRLYPGTPSEPATVLVEEGTQIARMTWTLIQRLGPAPDTGRM